MKYVPILFSTPLVIANQEGRKTQTRRIIKMRDGSLAEDEDISLHENGDLDYVMDFSKDFPYWRELKPKAMPGDIFWVRETTAEMFDFEDHPELDGNPREVWDMGFWYRTDGELNDAPFYIKGHKWKPSIFMPKEACRLFLKVTNVRVERLKDISMEDAIAEGIQPITAHNNPNRILGWQDYRAKPKDGIKTLESPRESFFSLWESINGKESLEANPWLFVYQYSLTQKPLLWP